MPANGPKLNPFVQAGGRTKLEAEALSLTAEVARLLDQDPAEVFRQANHYEGARTAKTNPADLTDNRLLNCVLDLRAMLKQAQDTAADRERRGANVRR